MKRVIWIFGAVSGLLLFWIGWMSLVNTRTAHLQIQLSGRVDQVSIFSSDDPSNPLAVISTGGKDTLQTIDLPKAQGFSFFLQRPPASYYFTTRRGSDTYRGSKVCCETGLSAENITLSISDLSEWELMDH